jgi:hypothetical protein
MQRRAVLARFLLIPTVVMAITGPTPTASAHSSRGLPIGPAPESRAAGAGNDDAFINFETPHVHPIDVSPDGTYLAACNTPDGRIEIYAINQTNGQLSFRSSVAVGVDPVSVRFRTNDEIWAVNAVSDSISIINRALAQVVDTIITYRLTDTGSALEGSPNGDEPMDLVFIDGGAQAVVSCSATDILQLYDTATRTLLDESLRLDGEEPRSLATDGNAVWAGIFESGNGTTGIMGVVGSSAGFPPDDAIESASNPYGGGPNGSRGAGEFYHDDAPAAGNGWNVEGEAVLLGDLAQAPPRSSLIVRHDGNGGWLDDNGRDWADFIDGPNATQSGRFTGWTLLDNDVARVVESSDTLSEDSGFGEDGYATRQMNIVMAIARNPVTGAIFSVGTDATNEIRFEPNILGTFTRVMLSVVDGTTGAQIALEDLNVDHLDAAQGGVGMAYTDGSVPQAERNKSIGDPRGIAFTLSGNHAYISGMGSNNLICVLASGGSIGNRVALGDTFEVPAGPTGLAHHGTMNRLYVLSKFASTITVVDTTTPGSESVVQNLSIYDPTPATIKNGRPHLYDTHANSGLGQIACASCHVDVRFDRLGWNLGNPAGGTPQGVEKPVRGLGDGLVTDAGTNPVGTHNSLFVQDGISDEASFSNFSSVKGVMTTQTLQDIIGKEPHHWRGDRDGIEEFAGAFSGLQGRDTDLTGIGMQQFKDFLASVWFEPNPMRPLDNALPGGPPLSDAFAGDHDVLAIPGHFSPGNSTGKFGFSALGTQLPPGDAFEGFDRYVDTSADNVFSCVVCHTLPIGSGSTHLILLTGVGEPPSFSATPIPPSTLGSAHLGMVSIDGTGQPHIKVAGLRNQIEKEGFYLNFPGVASRAGFGVLHDGSIDGTSRFLAEQAFDTFTDQDLANLVAFTLCVRGDDTLRLQNLSGAPTGGIPPAAADHTAHAAVGAQAVLPPGGNDFYADLFMDIAADDEVDLVVETRIGNRVRRFTHFDNNGDTRYLSDRAADGLVTQTTLETLVDNGFDLTYTALHESTGNRIGIDRDEDGAADGDEADLGSTSSNPNDTAFVGTNIPSTIQPLQTFTTVAAALAAVTPSSGRRAALHIEGASYPGAITINQPVTLRQLVDPVTGDTVGGVVRIGAP